MASNRWTPNDTAFHAAIAATERKARVATRRYYRAARAAQTAQDATIRQAAPGPPNTPAASVRADGPAP